MSGSFAERAAEFKACLQEIHHPYYIQQMRVRCGMGWRRLLASIKLWVSFAREKRQYSARETYNVIDPTDRSQPISMLGSCFKETYKEKAFYDSAPPCIIWQSNVLGRYAWEEPLIIGLFCGKWLVKIRRSITLRLPVLFDHQMCIYMWQIKYVRWAYIFGNQMCQMCIHMWQSNTSNELCLACRQDVHHVNKITMRGGGLGSRPKKMYWEYLGDGVEYHLMSPTPMSTRWASCQ